MESFSRWTMGVSGLGLIVALTGAAGCLGTADGGDAALAEPIAAGAQALTGWQCEACVSGEYTHSVSLSQGRGLPLRAHPLGHAGVLRALRRLRRLSARLVRERRAERAELLRRDLRSDLVWCGTVPERGLRDVRPDLLPWFY
jgi:hypothetical protein